MAPNQQLQRESKPDSSYCSHRSSGLKILELLLSLSILSFVVVLSIPSWIRQQNQAKQTEGRMMIHQINIAQETHFIATGQFSDLEGLALGSEDTANYSYSSKPSGEGAEAEVISTATAKGDYKSFWSRVYIIEGTQAAILMCEAPSGEEMNLSGRVTCPKSSISENYSAIATLLDWIERSDTQHFLLLIHQSYLGRSH